MSHASIYKLYSCTHNATGCTLPLRGLAKSEGTDVRQLQPPHILIACTQCGVSVRMSASAHVRVGVCMHVHRAAYKKNIHFSIKNE